ncbi:MAG: tetratricopeptide repeat protein [Cyclobacteriaceae bacterium]
MNRIILFFLIALGSGVSFSCSSQKDTFTNRLYHNITARFNAYYFAREKLLEFENEIEANYQEDFSQVLPVFYPIDSTIVESNEELLTEARSMASKAVDWHRISKWVDPSYFVIGKIDYYKGEFDEAQNTFKYLNVNSNQNDVRHVSLIQLLRSFIDLKQFDDAAFVIDYLSKENNISKENKQYLYKTLAYYYETRGENDMIVPSLFKALEFSDDKKEISRLNFMLGQLYQKAGLDAFAYEYYQKSLNGSPNYERTFFAQLYSQQVAELEKTKDLKRVRDYFDNLYKDRKNLDFRDVVLFEKGRFERKQGNLEDAISLYTKAAKEPGENTRQKGYIYQELSEIYQHEKNDYLTTKYYLDSALENFRETDRNYELLSQKKEIFDQYAENFELLQKNDSLINLSALSPEEQEAYVDAYLTKEEERLIKEAELANKKKSPGIFDNLLAFGGSDGGTSAFYWENPVAIQRGALEFTKIWGSRPLTDNWRRSNRSFQESENEEFSEIENEVDPDLLENENDVADDFDSGVTIQLPDKSTLIGNIPQDEETIEKMRGEMEEAYFNLGKLLYFDLHQPGLAVGYLEKLIENFPNTPKKPEAYYTLHLANKDLKANSDRYARLLNFEFPSSQFTKSINNPDQVSGSQANFESAQNYSEAYQLYKSGELEASTALIRKTLNEYPLTKNTDRLLLLDIMISGKTGSIELYRERLKTFVQNDSEPELLAFAEKLLKAVSVEDEAPSEVASPIDENTPNDQGAEEKLNGKNENMEAEEPPYKKTPEQTHIFILALNPSLAEESKNLTAELENFHAQNFSNQRLRTGTIALTRETTILIISPFSNANKSLEYQDAFLNSFNTEYLPEELKMSSFVISIENFQQLNKRKDVEEYRTFYKESY